MRPANITVIGAPLDLGQDRRGVDMGPSAIRVANIHGRLRSLGYTVSDSGNVPVSQREALDPGAESSRYLAEIAVTCKKLGAAVCDVLDGGGVPLVLGGDHSVAVGTVSGVSRHFRKARKRAGLLWIDAHADMNTPDTSPSGNVHGMPLACIAGIGPRPLTHLFGYAPKVEPKNIVLVGIRDVDQLERDYVKKSGVHVFTMRDIDERGLRAVMDEAIRLASDGTAGYHLSLDMDYLDPSEAPGVGTPVRGGGTYREAHLAMEMICDSRRMTSIEVVEVNPVLDVANRTADLAVELVMSALGKRIL